MPALIIAIVAIIAKIVDWIIRNKVLIRAALWVLAIAVVTALTLKLYIMLGSLVDHINALSDFSGGDWSVFRWVNSLVPATEILAQVFVLLTFRVTLLVFDLAKASIVISWKTVSKKIAGS